jgi:hypothetical protein
LVLFDKFGIAIDAKFVEKEEVISIGNEVSFPCYCAVVGSKVSGIQEKQQRDCSLEQNPQSLIDQDRLQLCNIKQEFDKQ